MKETFNVLRNFKTEEGRLLCEHFVRIPTRRSLPEYYEMVANPIDMIKIQQKVKTDEFDTLEDLSGDLMLLVDNAKAFYKVSVTQHEFCSNKSQTFNYLFKIKYLIVFKKIGG